MSDQYITCKQLIDFLWAYTSNELSAEERHEFDRHLGKCPSCVAYLDSYKKTVEMERSVVAEMAEDPCADAPEELVQAVLKARKRKT